MSPSTQKLSSNRIEKQARKLQRAIVDLDQLIHEEIECLSAMSSPFAPDDLEDAVRDPHLVDLCEAKEKATVALNLLKNNQPRQVGA